MDFDKGRLDVAKGAVGAYLNFRYGTEKIMENILGVLSKFEPENQKTIRPLYNRLSSEPSFHEATQDEINEAYNNKLEFYGKIPIEERSEDHDNLVQGLMDAYEILGDPEKRKSYNELGVVHEDVSLEWSKRVHSFALEIAMAWDKNDPPGASLRVLHVLKDVADGSVNYVIITFILLMYLSGLGWVAAIAPNMFIHVLVSVLGWLGVASGIINHVKNLGSTLAKITVHSTDLVNKAIQKEYGKTAADQLFLNKPILVDYLDTVLVCLRDKTKEQIDNMDYNKFEEEVKAAFQSDWARLVLDPRKQYPDSPYLGEKGVPNSEIMITLFAKPFLDGLLSRCLFYCNIAELALTEFHSNFEENYPRLCKTVETIEAQKDHPWIPLFIFAEGRDKYAVGAWIRYMESAEWNRYNELKERIESRVNWRSYEHQKDYFRVQLRHLKAIIGDTEVKQLFPLLEKHCEGDMSDTQWKTRHMVLYAHGNMSTAIKWLRCLRLKSR